MGFSGLGFLVDALPQTAQHYFLFVPMVNCLEIIRDGYFGSMFTAHFDVLYVLAWNSILSLLAMFGVRVVSTRDSLE